MGVTAGIFLASILLKEMRYLVYIRYLWYVGGLLSLAVQPKNSQNVCMHQQLWTIIAQAYVNQTSEIYPHCIRGELAKAMVMPIDILYTLDSASNYSAIQKLKPWLQSQVFPWNEKIHMFSIS